MSLPFFSVIIPTHGRPQLLQRAIQSVKANSFRDIEIIVVSDESNPATFEVLANSLSSDDVFVKRNGSAGPANSRNLGLSHARDSRAILDCLYVYRRWPSPTEEIRLKRRELMRKAGLELPLEWL